MWRRMSYMMRTSALVWCYTLFNQNVSTTSKFPPDLQVVLTSVKEEEKELRANLLPEPPINKSLRSVQSSFSLPSRVRFYGMWGQGRSEPQMETVTGKYTVQLFRCTLKEVIQRIYILYRGDPGERHTHTGSPMMLMIPLLFNREWAPALLIL